jgi:phasin family protein
MTTPKQFDFSDLFKRLDPTALTEQYKEFLGKFSMPNLDASALITAQNKNVQALTEANRAMLEGTQSLLQRQSEMVRQVLEESSEAMKSLASSGSPQEAVEKEIKMIEDSVSKALANFSEIGEMVRKTQDETTKLVTERFNENMAELRANISKLKPEGGKGA